MRTILYEIKNTLVNVVERWRFIKHMYIEPDISGYIDWLKMILVRLKNIVGKKK